MIDLRWLERGFGPGFAGNEGATVTYRVLQFRCVIGQELRDDGSLAPVWSDWQDVPTKVS